MHFSTKCMETITNCSFICPSPHRDHLYCVLVIFKIDGSASCTFAGTFCHGALGAAYTIGMFYHFLAICHCQYHAIAIANPRLWTDPKHRDVLTPTRRGFSQWDLGIRSGRIIIIIVACNPLNNKFVNRTFGLIVFNLSYFLGTTVRGARRMHCSE
jgi:hypothetical protein